MKHQIKTIYDKKAIRIILILCIYLFDMVFVIGYMHHLKQAGNLLGVSTASSHMPDILFQNIIEVVPMLFVLVLSLLLMKGESRKNLDLGITNAKTARGCNCFGIGDDWNGSFCNLYGHFGCGNYFIPIMLLFIFHCFF